MAPASARAAIETIAEEIAHAWNAHDAPALCAFYAEDADHVDTSGAIVHGRKAILTYHRRRFATVFTRSSLALSVIKLRLIARHAALLHGVWSMRGHEDPDRRWLPVRTGTFLVVLHRRRGTWRIALLQANSALPAHTTRQAGPQLRRPPR